MTATFRATKLDDSSGKLDTDIANSTFEKRFYKSDIVMLKAEKGFYESDIVMSKAEKGFYGSDIAMLKAEKGFYGSDIAMLKAEKGFCESDIAMSKAEKGFYGSDIVMSEAEKGFWNPDFVNYGREWLLKVSNQVTYFHAEGFYGNALLIWRCWNRYSGRQSRHFGWFYQSINHWCLYLYSGYRHYFIVRHALFYCADCWNNSGRWRL